MEEEEHPQIGTVLLAVQQIASINRQKSSRFLFGDPGKEYVSCLEIVISYLKLQTPSTYFDKDFTPNKKQDHSEDFDPFALRTTKKNRNSFDNSDSDETENGDTINHELNNSILSVDLPWEPVDDYEIYDTIYIPEISKFEKKKFVFDSYEDSFNLNILKIATDFEKRVQLNENVKCRIFGTQLLKDLAENDKISKAHISNNTEIFEDHYIIYFYIFLNAFQSSFIFFDNIKSYFGDDKIKTDKATFEDANKKFFTQIELWTYLLSTYDMRKYELNYLLQSLDSLTLLNWWNDWITPVLAGKNEVTTYESWVQNYVFRETKQSHHIVAFYKNITKILDCIGSLISFIPERPFSNIISSDFLDKYYAVLQQGKADPIVWQGVCLLFNKVLNSSQLFKNEINFSKFFTKAKNFRNWWNYLNNSKTQFRNTVDYYRKLDLKKPSKDLDNPYDFNVIKSPEVINFLISIIKIFLSINRWNLTVPKQIQWIIEELHGWRMYDLLGNCLKIVRNDEIRKLAIECFWFVDHKVLSTEIILQIINIIKKYTSVTVGETEYILSLIYLTLNNKLMHTIATPDSKQWEPIKMAVSAGIYFLYWNTDRNPDDEEETLQKNTLSISIIIFLLTASHNPHLFSEIFDETDQISYALFKKVWINDFIHWNETNYLPLEIEKTHLGMYIVILLEVMEGYSFLPPYSYPFLRVMIKTADNLCNITDDCYILRSFSAGCWNFKELINNSKNRWTNKISNEINNWFVFRTTPGQGKEMKQPCSLNEIKEDDIFNIAFDTQSPSMIEGITKIETSLSCGVDSNKERCTFKQEENSQAAFNKFSTNDLITGHWQFLTYFPNLLNYLLGFKSNLHQCKDPNITHISKEWKEKYYQQILNSDETMRLWYEYSSTGSIETLIGNIKQYENEIPFSSSWQNSLIKNIKTKSLHSYLKLSNLLNYDIDTKRNLLLSNQSFHGDWTSFSWYGLDPASQRLSLEETVNNPHLRSLIINAFSRSVYALLISPSIEIRRSFIEWLFIDNKYKQVLMYILTQKYYWNYNAWMLIDKIFAIDNLPKILEACAYKPEEQYFGNRDKVKEWFNKIFVVQDFVSQSQRHKQQEEMWFHNYYITTLFWEKEIIKNKRNWVGDYLYLISLERALHSWWNSFLQINFNWVDNFFRDKFIVSKLCNHNNIELIFSLFLQCERHSIHAFNICKEFNREFLHTQSKLLSFTIGRNSALAGEVNDKTEEILKYIAENEREFTRIKELIAIMIYLNPELQNNISFNFLELKNERAELIDKLGEKHVPNSTVSPEEDSGKNDKFKQDNSMKIQANINEIDNTILIFKLKQTIIQKYKREELVIISAAFITLMKRERSISSASDFTDYFMVITDKAMMLFKYNLKTAEIFLDKSVISVALDTFSQILFLDYISKVMITTKNKERFLITFASKLAACNTVDIIRNHIVDIETVKSVNWIKYINAFELSDETYKNNYWEKMSKALIKDGPIFATAKEILFSRIKTIVQQSENLITETTIERNIYKRDKYAELLGNKACFYFIKEEKCAYFGNLYLFIIKEKPEMFLQLDSLGDSSWDYVVGFSDVWSIEQCVNYEDISNVESDFDNLRIKIMTKSNGTLAFEFNDKFDIYLFSVLLTRIEEYSMDRFIKMVKKKNINFGVGASYWNPNTNTRSYEFTKGSNTKTNN